METKLKFTDFKPEELVGKIVLFTSGNHRSPSRSITKIIAVTKTGFRIDKEPTFLFNLIDGSKKGISNSRMNWDTVCDCELITDEQVANLRKEFAAKRETTEIKKMLNDKLQSLTHEQLLKIREIIK
jgi:hypothetical protein